MRRRWRAGIGLPAQPAPQAQGGDMQIDNMLLNKSGFIKAYYDKPAEEKNQLGQITESYPNMPDPYCFIPLRGMIE